MKTRAVVAIPITLAISCLPSWAQTGGSLEEALAEIVTRLSQQMQESEIKKVAVVPFPDLNGFQSALGEFLAEELITQLFVQNPGRFAVVERRQLNKVLAEQQLSTSSVFEADNITKLGKILGVDAIVTGSIADLGAEVKINARAIAISTASVFAAAAAKAPKSGIAENLMMQNAPVPQGGAMAAAPPAQRSDAYFSNSFLRIGIAQVAKSSESGQIMLALSLEDLTSSDLLLALAVDDHSRCTVSMMDDLGNRYQPNSWSFSFPGMPCVSRSNLDEADRYATLSARSKAAVMIPLVSGAEVLGSAFSVAATFVKFEEDLPKQFSVGISNVHIAP